MNTSPDHPDFTALALGEHIHGTPARAVIEALRTSVSARAEAEQIQNAGRLLSCVLKNQPPLRLDANRRNAIFAADIDAVRARFEEEERAAFEEEDAVPVVRRRQTWIFPAAAAAAIAVTVVAALRLLPGYSSSRATQDPLTGEPDNIIRVTPGNSAGEKSVPIHIRQQSPAIAEKEAPSPVLPQGSDLPAPPEAPVIVKEPMPQFPVIPATPPADYASPPAPGTPASNQGGSDTNRYKRGGKTL
ncbi:MAG TPA: hypothetical protein VG796_30775 [Verrucomicrobiales bacterium]|jgi:hypothetical protein|nr:hypothetical protein [Verrucomicrobiales bacterium]